MVWARLCVVESITFMYFPPLICRLPVVKLKLSWKRKKNILMSQSDSTGDCFCLSPFHSSRLHRGVRGRLKQVPWLKRRPCPSLVNTQFHGSGRTRSMHSAKRVMWEMAGPPDAIHQWSRGESYSCAFLFNSVFIKPSVAKTPWLLTSKVRPMSGHFGNEKCVEIFLFAPAVMSHAFFFFPNKRRFAACSQSKSWV